MVTIIKENKDLLQETILQLYAFEEKLKEWQRNVFAEIVSAYLDWEKSLFMEIPAEESLKREVREVVLKKFRKGLREVINTTYLTRTNLSRKHYQEALPLMENLILWIGEQHKEKENYPLLRNLKRIKVIIKTQDNYN